MAIQGLLPQRTPPITLSQTTGWGHEQNPYTAELTAIAHGVQNLRQIAQIIRKTSVNYIHSQNNFNNCAYNHFFYKTIYRAHSQILVNKTVLGLNK